jgi:hypothetical protein
MASDSVTDERGNALDMYNNVADAGTMALLWKLQGVLHLLREATCQLKVEEPCPDGVDTGIWAAQHLVDDALCRAGAL